MFVVYYYGPALALVIAVLMIAYYRIKKSVALRVVGEDWVHWVLLAGIMAGAILAFSLPGPVIIRTCFHSRDPNYGLQINCVRIGCGIVGLGLACLLHWMLYRSVMTAPQNKIKL